MGSLMSRCVPCARILALAGLVACPVGAEDQPQDLTRLSIDELAAMKVVTVSRRPEAQLQAAGAVHVLTSEDVRRAAATTLADVLRLSPGVQASVIDANEWALAVRGFASRLSRSVLVLMDGRSLWTPLFAGVFWDAQDTMMEDLDRIEVSRGPGGALYGANALNGVINIVTRDAWATQGGLATVAGGSAERTAALRWGDTLGSHTAFRVHGRYLRRDGTTPSGTSGYDDTWRFVKGGLRLDTQPASSQGFTLLADAYDGRSRTAGVAGSFTAPFALPFEGPVRLRGGSIVGRWRRAFEGGGDAWLQVYYDHTRRQEPHYAARRHTADVEMQHHFQWGGAHDTVWGASYRLSHGVFDGTPVLHVVPPARTDDIAGLFVHDETRLGDRVRLMLGSKVEWNDYSGWNLQPSARLAWTPSERHTFWAAAARAVRTSSRIEHDVVIYTPLSATQPLFARVTGSPDFQPESVLTWEAGYKTRPLSGLLLDVAAFHSRYDDLASNEVGPPVVEPGVPPGPPLTVLPVRLANGQEGSASGIEATATASVSRRWRVQAAYSFLRVNQTPKPGSSDRNEGFEGNSPRHQLWVASYFTVTGGLDLDLVFRRVGRIATHAVPAFSELDARLGLRVRDLELSVAGKNLLHARHAEFGGGFEVDRSVLARATLEW